MVEGFSLGDLVEVARGVRKVLDDVRDLRGVALILDWGRRLGLPREVVREAVQTFLSHGFRSDEAAAASLYLACVRLGHHITPSRITLVTNIRSSTYRWLLAKIAGGGAVGRPRKTPEDAVVRIAKALSLDENVVRLAQNIISELRKRTTLSGKHAETVGAGAVYIAASRLGHDIMKKKVAEAAAISAVSLRNAIRFISEKLGSDLARLPSQLRELSPLSS